MKNISYVKDCYGCGVCASACPKHIIELSLSEQGFYEPNVIDSQECTQCGLCLSVCAFVDKELSRTPGEILSYSSYSNNSETRKSCSSGGIGYEIGKLLIEKGYKACSVRYNYIEHRAEHYIADTLEGFEVSKGSKYLQSYTVDAFLQLSPGDKFVVFGTPCQIDSLYRWIRKFGCEDNYVLVDFFCHGTPSYHVWNSYLNYQSRKKGLEGIQRVSFRDKKYGWHHYTIKLTDGVHSFYSSTKNHDLFYSLFFGDVCLNKPCYLSCKYKNTMSCADIRIGDLWGNKFAKDENGISGLFALSDKGHAIISDLSSVCTIAEENPETVTEGQMKKSPPIPWIRGWVIRQLRNPNSLERVYKLLLWKARLLNIHKILYRKFLKR